MLDTAQRVMMFDNRGFHFHKFYRCSPTNFFFSFFFQTVEIERLENNQQKDLKKKKKTGKNTQSQKDVKAKSAPVR